MGLIMDDWSRKWRSLQALARGSAKRSRTSLPKKARASWYAGCKFRSCRSLHSQYGRKDFTIVAVIFGNAIGKIDGFAVRRSARRCSAAFRIRNQPWIGAIGIHHKYLIAMATAVRGERDLRAVRRPRRPAVEERVVCKVARISSRRHRQQRPPSSRRQ